MGMAVLFLVLNFRLQSKVNLLKPPNFLLFFYFNVCKSAMGLLLVLYRQIGKFVCLYSCFLNCDVRK